MKQPELLVPNMFIVLVFEENGLLKYTVATTRQKYKSSWKRFLGIGDREPTHVDAHYVGRHKELVQWDEILSWDYIDTRSVIEGLPEWVREKHNV